MKIFPKLFLLFAGLAAVPLGIAASLIHDQAGRLEALLREEQERTAQRTTAEARRALEAQATRVLSSLAREKALFLDDRFNDIAVSVTLQAHLVGRALRAPAGPGESPAYTADQVVEMLRDPDHAFSRTMHEREPYVTYNLSPGVDPDSVREAIRRLTRLGTPFAHNQRSLPWCMSSYLGHADGFILGYPGRSRYPEGHDARLRPWYVAAVKNRSVTWSELYLDRNQRDIVITCSAPVLDDAGGVAAVSAIDVKLTRILEHLFDLRDHQATDAILLDPDGRVQVSKGATLQPQPVASFQEGEYRPVYDRILAGDAAAGGTVRVEGPRAALYAYAPVPALKAGDRAWTYVARVPVETVTAPAGAMERTLAESNATLAGTISRSVRGLWTNFFIVLVVVLGLSLVAAWGTARSFTRPIRAVAEVAESIGRGNLDRRADVPSSDEIGQLAETLNAAIDGLRERDQVKRVLKQYVSPSVADHLMKEPGKLKLGGDRKELTVLFSDIAKFTALSERFTPEELVALMNRFLSAMTDAVFRHDGTLDKYVGDAVMAFWGAPVDQPDHAARACRAALDMQRAAAELSKEWREMNLPPLRVRIGINSGPMVVGNVGSSAHMGYTVMGDAVNLASRLEGTNKAYGTSILLGHSTRKAAGDAVVAREIDRLIVRGRTEPEAVHELVGAPGDVAPARMEDLRTFEKGLEAYRARDWARAAEIFGSLPGDPVARTLLDRSEGFRNHPPPEDWDGTTAIRTK